MFDISAVVNEVCDIMRFPIEQKGLKLKLKISKNMPNKILGDVKRIKQVLFNLLGNAVKFTFTGHIAVRLDFDEPSQQLNASITDTGIGI